MIRFLDDAVGTDPGRARAAGHGPGHDRGLHLGPRGLRHGEHRLTDKSETFLERDDPGAADRRPGRATCPRAVGSRPEPGQPARRRAELPAAWPTSSRPRTDRRPNAAAGTAAASREEGRLFGVRRPVGRGCVGRADFGAAPELLGGRDAGACRCCAGARPRGTRRWCGWGRYKYVYDPMDEVDELYDLEPRTLGANRTVARDPALRGAPPEPDAGPAARWSLRDGGRRPGAALLRSGDRTEHHDVVRARHRWPIFLETVILAV